MKRCLVDTNVWLALVYEAHQHHGKVAAWFRRERPIAALFCRQTQIGLMRLLTERKVMADDVRTMFEAWSTFDGLVSRPGVGWVEEPEGIEEEMRLLSSLDSSSPKLWADAYLTAFANRSGLAFVTLDRGFETRGDVRELSLIR